MPSWTDEQRRAIDARGDILVSAGAGSGKTAVLTERIVRLVREGLDIKNLLCVTFTVSAANEMKKRIERALYAAADSEPDDGEAARLHAAARACPGASISTLHSFCNQVLKRHFNEAGLDPAFRIADSSETDLMRDDVWDELCEARLSGDNGSFAALMDALGGDENTFEAVNGLYNFICSQAEPEAFLLMAAQKYDTDADSLSVSAETAELIAGTSLRLRLASDRLAQTRDGVAALSPGAAAVIDEEIMHARMISIQTDPSALLSALATKPHPDIRNIRWGACEGVAREQADDARKKLTRALNTERGKWTRSIDEEAALIRAQAPFMRELCDAVRDFSARFSSLKQSRGVIDYSDMEHICLALLSREEIAKEYRRRFKYVFMDEYQDCNAVQEKLILSIAEPGALFLVGDVKQSIYRFRSAEPSLFIKRYASYADGALGERIDLNANFRSSSGVIDAVNSVFSRLMTADAAELDYDNAAALKHGRTEDGLEGESPRAEFVLLDMLERGDTATANDAQEEDGDAAQDEAANDDMSAARAEALAAADSIHHMIECETLFDPALGRRRAYRYSDFAVLLRSYKGVAQEWLETLSLKGVPAYGELAGGFFDAVEVKLFIELLRIIDNRTLDIPMAAVLRSPIGGFDTRELIELKTAFAPEIPRGEGWRCYDSLLAAAECETELGGKAKDFIRRLDRWRERAKLMSVEALLGALMDETDYALFCRALPGGRQREANLDALCEKARLFENTGSRGLHAFLEYSDKLRSAGAEGSPQSAGANVVRVMSVHASKGLEFPAVIIGGLAKQFNTSSARERMLADASLGVGARFIINGIKSDSLYVNAIASRGTSKSIAEEMRVLYVAMTRAREKLIMLCASRNAQKLVLNAYNAPQSPASVALATSFAAWLLGVLLHSEEGEALRKRYDLAAPANAPKANISVCTRLVSGGREETERLSPAEYARFSKAAAENPVESPLFGRVYPFEGETGLPSKVSVTGLAGHEIHMSEAPDFLLDERMSATDRGTAFHAIMQLIPLEEHTAGTVREAMAKAEADGLMTPSQVKSVDAGGVAAFFQSDVGRRLIACRADARRELEFNITMRAGELGIGGVDAEGRVILQGVIDCCFLENGEWVLVDYKTDRIPAGASIADAANKHARQINLYAGALERLTGIRVKQRFVYFFGVGEAVEIKEVN